jgi:peroxiredoxin
MRSVFIFLLSAASVFAGGQLSGRRAPGFALPDTKMQYHDPQDYRGKVVIVEFMQTNCPHCARFSSILEEVRQKYAGRVVVLSVVTPPDTMDTVGKFIAANKVTSPMLFDCGQVAASYLKVTPQNPRVAVPHVFLIDGQGMIRNDFGYNEAEKQIFEGRALFGEIEKLLAKK